MFMRIFMCVSLVMSAPVATMSTAVADDAPARMKELDAVKTIRTTLERDAARGAFSGVVFVVKDGRVVFNDSFGYSDREKKVLNGTETRFNLADMTRMFTAVAVMQLVEAGKVKLNDPIGVYLPEYPNKDVAETVTVAQLLSQTDGLRDVMGTEFSSYRRELRDMKAALQRYGRRNPAYAPGAHFADTDYGYIVLGAMIEEVSGQDYHDYIRQHIYAPARMKRAGSEPEDTRVDYRAIGYTKTSGEMKPNTDMLPYRGLSSRGSYATVEDLVRFAEALMDNRLLNAENTAFLLTGRVPLGPEAGGDSYAYGFVDGATADGTRYIGRDGAGPGMNSALRILPGAKTIVAVLCNTDPAPAENIARFISDRLPKE
jgi:CubicO group peptidase (beta-lactamase class C family)